MTDLMVWCASGVLLTILEFFLLFQTSQLSLVTQELWCGQVVAERNKQNITQYLAHKQQITCNVP